MPVSVHPSLEAGVTRTQSHQAVKKTALVSAFVGLAILGDSALYAVLPTQIDILGINAAIVGVALSLNRVVRLLTNQLANRLVVRYTAANTFLWALIATIATTAVWAFNVPALFLLAGRALWGLCWSILRLGGYLTALEGHESQQGRLFGLFRSGFRSGSLVAAIGAGLLTDFLGFRRAFVIIAGVSSLAIPLYLILQPLRGVQGGPKPKKERVTAENQTNYRAVKRTAKRINIGALIHSLTLSLFTTTMGYYLTQNLAADTALLGVATLNGLLFAWLWISNIAIGPACGLLADKLGMRKVTLLLLITECLALCTVAITSTLWLLLPAILILLAAGPGLEVVLDTQAGAVATVSGHRSQIMATYSNWVDAGSALGPLIGFPLGNLLGLPLVYLLGTALLLFWGFGLQTDRLNSQVAA
jgi:MFS family permease